MLSTRKVAALLLSWLVIANNGCLPIPRTYAKAELLGTYEIKYSFGTDTLILKRR